LADSETNAELGHWCCDTTQIVAIKQVSIAILSCREYELRRICSRHVDKHRAHTAEISIAIIEREPIGRRPVVGWLTTPERSGLQTNNRFAAAPHPSSATRVARDHEHVGAIAGNAAVSPDAAFDGRGRPSHHDSRGIVYLHAYYPTMIAPAVSEIS
jgi:hypothetical protein